MVWNANHGWASFHKQFGRVVRDQTYAPSYLLEFIGSFVGLASPIIAVLALAGLWHVMASSVRRREQPGVLLAASVLPQLLYFLVHALHARVQPNWIAPLYPSLAACAALAARTLTGCIGAFDRVPSAVSLGVGHRPGDVRAALPACHPPDRAVASCQRSKQPTAGLEAVCRGHRPVAGGDGRLLGCHVALRDHRTTGLSPCLACAGRAGD